MVRFSTIAAVAAAAFCAATSPHPAPAAVAKCVQEQEGNFPKIDLRYASPGSVLAVAYQAIGYDGPKAIEMANDELRRLGLSENAPDPNVVPLDWKNSNLHTVLYDAMLHDGYPEPTLTALANLAYEKVTGQRLISQPFEGTEEFMAYPMHLIYCDAEGERRQIKAWTQNGCIDRLYKSECTDRIPDCTGRDDAWFQVRRSDVDPLWTPSPGSFVYVRWRREPAMVPHLIEPRNCDLFVELSPIDCDAIDYVCGDSSMGPPGGLDGR